MKRLYSEAVVDRLFILLLILSGEGIPSTLAQGTWSADLPTVGTFSSPRVTDLNGDGIGDVILGAGRREFLKCDSAIIALDGKSGKMLWHKSAIDQVFGSAALKDITGDGTMDVFINGRSALLEAINARTGDIIWKFKDPDKHKRWKKRIWFNFYDPQFVSDQNGDGVDDILISNGGDVKAKPYDPHRPAGFLAVISGKDGSLLSKAIVPDGKETYMSVVAVKEGNDYRVIFGTGGETLGGSLYVTRLSDIMKGDISHAIHLDSSATKGFIGPPVWADITGDNVPDIIANAVDGRLEAFDGKTYKNLWHVYMPHTEAYSSIAPGYFNRDSIPDFFVSYAKGKWPDLNWTKQFMVNGKNGKIEYVDSLGFYQTSTPVVADFTQDGIDDALMVVNYVKTDSLFERFFYNMLVVVDFANHKVIDLGISKIGNNLSSTPWIGDMNGDGFMDIVYCHGTNLRHTYTFDGMQVEHLATRIRITKKIRWGAYMGSHYDGVFK